MFNDSYIELMAHAKVPVGFNKILAEYFNTRVAYYREKLSSDCSLQDIIQESVNAKDSDILQYIVLNEFPQHKSTLFKYLIIQ
jgi:hypothetical protein